MRNLTSIFGIPAGIGSIARSSKRASERQSLASSRSPWTTCRSTTVCPSTDVVNISRALVGVELAVRRLAEQLLDAAPEERHPRRAADQDDLVDVRQREAGVGERH